MALTAVPVSIASIDSSRTQLYSIDTGLCEWSPCHVTIPAARRAMAKNASAAACEVANAAARSERPELAQRGYLTKAVMCDVHPFCATETLFSHEFSWTPQRERKVVSRCRSWQTDADWPTTEPYLSRKTAVPRPRTFWDIMQLLPNRTVWLHGDSIQLQMCDAAICSLMRAGAASEPVFGGSSVMPARLRAALAPSKYNFMTTLLPNGARLLCSGIGIYQRENVEKVLPHVDVAVLNFGLHYHNAAHFEGALSDALLTLSLWRKVSPRTRVALWREGSAQHCAPHAHRTCCGLRSNHAELVSRHVLPMLVSQSGARDPTPRARRSFSSRRGLADSRATARRSVAMCPRATISMCSAGGTSVASLRRMASGWSHSSI